MKKIFALCLISVSAWAHPLPLSSTFEIRPRDPEIQWNFLPVLNSWRSETTWQDEKFSVTVIHSKPLVFANEFSVKKNWSEQSKRTATTSKILEDKKCKRVGRVHFVCERTVNENNDLLANEKIYWNENSDLVLVRVSTLKNRDALKRFSGRLDVQLVSRLPASNHKAVKK
jgi:hypothetical protein